MEQNNWTVYALSSLVKRYVYVGLTKNLERRFKEHQGGRVRSTKPYRPFKVIYTEQCYSRIMARGREVYLKSGVGKEFLKQFN
jgi:putative endonuclease